MKKTCTTLQKWDKGASINYVDRILKIFDPLTPLRWQVCYISLCCIVDIWATPSLPLACQRSLWMLPNQNLNTKSLIFFEKWLAYINTCFGLVFIQKSRFFVCYSIGSKSGNLVSDEVLLPWFLFYSPYSSIKKGNIRIWKSNQPFQRRCVLNNIMKCKL